MARYIEHQQIRIDTSVDILIPGPCFTLDVPRAHLY